MACTDTQTYQDVTDCLDHLAHSLFNRAHQWIPVITKFFCTRFAKTPSEHHIASTSSSAFKLIIPDYHWVSSKSRTRWIFQSGWLLWKQSLEVIKVFRPRQCSCAARASKIQDPDLWLQNIPNSGRQLNQKGGSEIKRLFHFFPLSMRWWLRWFWNSKGL